MVNAVGLLAKVLIWALENARVNRMREFQKNAKTGEVNEKTKIKSVG